MTKQIARHYPAFKGEIQKYFDLAPGKIVYDLTLGDGGHTQEALEAGCRVISVDVDRQAINRAVSFIPNKFHPVIIGPDVSEADKNATWLVIKANFTSIGELAKKLSLPKADAVIVDLGPSQFQVLSPGRGFSFLTDEPLDMRLSPDLGVTAADLVNGLNLGELIRLLDLADEPYARPIARAIVKVRSISPINSTKQLSELVSRVKKTSGRTHPATKTFMALRMAVNLEREAIISLLPQIPGLLKKDGILGIISFHSGEDRMVKDFIKKMEEAGILSAINPKPLEPKSNKLKISHRVRSAKLRLARKIID